MSQHVIPIDKTKECLVGWDPPLNTFFGQVYRIDEHGGRIDIFEEGGEEKDGTILWVGGFFGEISTVSELAKKLSPFVTLPRNVLEMLMTDAN